MFPSLINCTQIDWFHPWPENALIDVAKRFLADVQLPDEELTTKLAEHMSFVHLSVDDFNREFLLAERR